MLYDGMPIESVNRNGRPTISWTVSNKCNFQCRYCGDLRLGTSRSPTPTPTIIANIKHLASTFRAMNPDVQPHVLLTGGEPTLHPGIAQFIDVFHESGFLVDLITNGSRTIDWWRKSNLDVDVIVVSYHAEYTNDDHFINVIDYWVERGIIIIIPIMFHNDQILFDRAHDMLIKAFKRYRHAVKISVGVLRKQDSGINDADRAAVIDYTTDQLKIIERLGKLTDQRILTQQELSTPAAIRLVDNTTIRLNKSTQPKLQGDWYGYKCWSHFSFLQIDEFGMVGRQSCGQLVAHQRSCIWDDDFIENFDIFDGPVRCDRKRACGCFALTRAQKERVRPA